MTLVELEQQQQFTYPALYRQLAQDGMLDVGQYGPDWMATVFPKLREHPTLLLLSNSFELLSLDDAREATAALADPADYRAVNPAYQFIAFAQNGGGDYFCFFPTARRGAEVPIVALWHDANEATFLAGNLQDFIFRRILTDMANQDTYNKVSDADFRRDLTATLSTHSRYLTAAQNSILQEIMRRNIIDYTVAAGDLSESARGLLTADELQALLREIIPFAQLDESFPYATS